MAGSGFIRHHGPPAQPPGDGVAHRRAQAHQAQVEAQLGRPRPAAVRGRRTAPGRGCPAAGRPGSARRCARRSAPASRVAAIASMTSVPPGPQQPGALGQHRDVVVDVLEDLARHHDVGAAVGQRNGEHRAPDRQHPVLAGQCAGRAARGRRRRAGSPGGRRAAPSARRRRRGRPGRRRPAARAGCARRARRRASAASRTRPRGSHHCVGELVVLGGVVAPQPARRGGVTLLPSGGSWPQFISEYRHFELSTSSLLRLLGQVPGT